MIIKTYYHTPTQVKVEDPDGEGYITGIAYQDFIICGCCGGIFELADLNEDGLEIIDFEEWVNLNETIQYGA